MLDDASSDEDDPTNVDLDLYIFLNLYIISIILE